MVRIKRHIIRLFTLLLLFTAAATQAWAAKVTYHILTLPIDNSIYHMRSEVNGWRMEAIKVDADNADKVELPAYLKSPLAKNFTYYQAAFVAKKSDKTEKVYENNIYNEQQSKESNDEDVKEVELNNAIIKDQEININNIMINENIPKNKQLHNVDSFKNIV